MRAIARAWASKSPAGLGLMIVRVLHKTERGSGVVACISACLSERNSTTRVGSSIRVGTEARMEYCESDIPVLPCRLSRVA